MQKQEDRARSITYTLLSHFSWVLRNVYAFASLFDEALGSFCVQVADVEVVCLFDLCSEVLGHAKACEKAISMSFSFACAGQGSHPWLRGR